jgi:PncC family amidohydrolase
MKNAQQIIKKLKNKNRTLAVAESCTGGWLGKSITDVSGASDVFSGGVIAYSNDIKRKVLKVSGKTLLQTGAVSKKTAKAMARGVKRLLGSSYAVSITGIAGPTGGMKTKPVGLVWVAVSTPSKTKARHFNFKGGRHRIRSNAVTQALRFLLHEIR